MTQANHDGDPQSPNPYATPKQLDADDRLPLKLSIPLLIVLLALIVLAFLTHVGLGAAMLLVSIPAYARAAGATALRNELGQANTTLSRLISFIGSFAVVIVCAVAGCIAFFCTCTASFIVAQPLQRSLGGENLMWASFALSGIGFLIGAVTIYRAWWPRRKKLKR